MAVDETQEQPEVEEQDNQPLRIDEVEDDATAARARAKTIDDDEDETWTNQPVAGRAEEVSGDVLEEEDLEEEPEQHRAPRKVIQNGRDVICDELPDRAQRAGLRLKPYLTARILVELTNSGERYLFDWREDAPKVRAVSREETVTTEEGLAGELSSDKLAVDAHIALSEQHLMAVRSGDLNPQVGMLTEKIKVKGKVSPAVYIFNLIAPRSRS
ncbi:MAG: hypothetical protein RL326_1403 [Pseudomonadota bacterium]